VANRRTALNSVSPPLDDNSELPLLIETAGIRVMWPRLSGQLFRVDKWSVCPG
jgi:hypothetical protein